MGTQLERTISFWKMGYYLLKYTKAEIQTLALAAIIRFGLDHRLTGQQRLRVSVDQAEETITISDGSAESAYRFDELTA